MSSDDIKIAVHHVELEYLGEESCQDEPDFPPGVFTTDPPAWRIAFEEVREWIRPYLAEGVAAMIYVIFGCSAVAMFTLSEGLEGSWLNVCVAFGVGITFAVYLSAPISGGHTSPAITVCCAIFKGFPWSKVPGYIISQVIGGFVGASVVFVTNYSTINAFDGGVRGITGLSKTGTSGIFVSMPSPHVTTGYQIWNEFIADVIFTSLVWLVIDHKSSAFNPHLTPFLIGLIVIAVASSISLQGMVINPARDIGPRIFAALIYGPEMFLGGHFFFWIPLVIPFFGCIAGAGLYDLLFQVHPRKGDPLPH